MKIKINNVKARLRMLVVAAIMLMVGQTASAYVTLSPEQYTVGVGETKYLSVPSSSRGYIGKAVWACSNSAISFLQKDNSGAQIKVTRSFSGVAIVELVCVETYTDINGRTQAITYSKEFRISCASSGSGSLTSISFNDVEVEIGTVVEVTPTLRPYNATVVYHRYSKTSGDSAQLWIEWSSSKVMVRGIRPGTSKFEIETANGKTATLEVTVPRPKGVAFVKDGNGDNIYDTNLQNAVSAMENLVNETLQRKK